MHESIKNRRLSKRRGAVLVEFALVLPIIMLFFAAMFEISRVLLLQHTADTAAYEGARSAMVPGATSEQAYKAADTLLKAARLRSTSIKVTPEVISESTPLITVQVQVAIAENSWITPRWITRSSVSSEVTLFCERPPIIQLTGVPMLKAKNAKGKSGPSGL